ncbi:MAG: aminotransferase class I/II-fold pyridoxal phosphate-dependent enzyme [Ruminococcaceae bacterium]|nr:aminotransferase class I/II-fold pyridoxal phosphate-dependent enzyme [Oscillospiraceae bacterium]
MAEYKNMSKAELEALKAELEAKYKEQSALGLNLDMSRGKPGADQLDLCEGLLTAVSTSDEAVLNGTDLRNYGGLDGIAPMKAMFAELLGVSASEVLVGGNSSLNMMYDTIARAMLFGILGEKPWSQQGEIKFLCPSPGYDRHFAVCEAFGIKMIPVEMNHDGPDMDTVEKLVSTDASVKGIWCVPKYSNPQGITYADEVVTRFANLKPAAKDFRIFWDNAYCVHDLTDTPDQLKEILSACKEAGNPNMVFEFASTSKISFPGGGVAVMVASEENLDAVKKIITFQTIGPDKINQYRHVKYFKDADGVHAHMKKQAALLKPKFDIVCDTLEKELSGLGIASWVRPNGGYFVSLDVLPGCAKKVHALLKDANVVMTKAGATYPYGVDPKDSNLRIAPTLPTVPELAAAMNMLCLCVRLAAVSKLLEA